MKRALIQAMTYKNLPIRFYLCLDDDYSPPPAGENIFHFEIDYIADGPQLYTDSFCSYPSFNAAYVRALEAADKLA